MSSSAPSLFRRRLVAAAATVLLAILLPASASAHSQLLWSVPANGTTVDSPFNGPIVLSFSAHLADGSRADLVGPNGSTLTTASIDPAGESMTFSLAAPLAPGAYQAEWISLADDGFLLRGIVGFTVADAASIRATAAASPATTTDAGLTGVDVVAPIALAVVIAAAGAFYLGRRNRPG